VPPIVVTTDVERPAVDVFSYATDPNRFSEWQTGVVGGRTEEQGPPSVGDRCVTTRRIGFADRPVTSEITHIEAPKEWAVRGVDGPVRAAVEVTVESLSESSSRLTISLDFEGHGIGTILIPLFVLRQARKEMPANLAALKRRLEVAA
jgi:uncharacterized protein YndB with AHSA1/START domain